VSLNIKNQRVHDLAREAARVTGKSQTSAIEEALMMLSKEYGEDPAAAERAQRVAQARLVLDWFAANPGDPDREIASIDDLYDEETGLPR
jgi:antitoxin VapB